MGEDQETTHENGQLSSRFIGPDLRRHYAPTTFSSKMNAEAWLARETRLQRTLRINGETWKPPAERKLEKKAEVLRLSQYGKTVIDQRKLGARTRIEYEVQVVATHRTETGQARGAGYDHHGGSGLVRRSGFRSQRATDTPTAILNMICNTAVKDGLLERNPCQIVGASNPKPKKEVKIPTTVELHGIADKLGADERTAQFNAMVLLAGWCGMRFGEVSELRRRDFDLIARWSRSRERVTHRADPNTPGADLAGSAPQRTVNSAR